MRAAISFSHPDIGFTADLSVIRLLKSVQFCPADFGSIISSDTYDELLYPIREAMVLASVEARRIRHHIHQMQIRGSKLCATMQVCCTSASCSSNGTANHYLPSLAQVLHQSFNSAAEFVCGRGRASRGSWIISGDVSLISDAHRDKPRRDGIVSREQFRWCSLWEDLVIGIETVFRNKMAERSGVTGVMEIHLLTQSQGFLQLLLAIDTRSFISWS
jgi:hypothetical protein